MRSHRLSVTGEHERLRARMHHAALGEVALSRLSYGASVQIDPDPLDAFFLIQMLLAGGAQIANGAQRIESRPSWPRCSIPTTKSTCAGWPATTS